MRRITIGRDFEIVDHFTYGLVSDGDLMEGVSSEAASLAGQLELGKLIYLFDNNHVTLSAGTNITCNEDHATRFEAYGWHTQSVEDGNDVEAIDLALRAARSETRRPSLILVRTHLGFGSPDKQDTFEAHGSPLGVEEVKLTKQNLGWPVEPLFDIPPEALAHFREACRVASKRSRSGAIDSPATPPYIPTWPVSFKKGCAANCPPGGMRTFPFFRRTRRG